MWRDMDVPSLHPCDFISHIRWGISSTCRSPLGRQAWKGRRNPYSSRGSTFCWPLTPSKIRKSSWPLESESARWCWAGGQSSPWPSFCLVGDWEGPPDLPSPDIPAVSDLPALRWALKGHEGGDAWGPEVVSVSHWPVSLIPPVGTTLSSWSGHARKCNETAKSYCVNGGVCYYIEGINQLSCK